METTKNHVKLFDKSFTLQLFRVLLPIGLTMTVLELLISLNVLTVTGSLLFGTAIGQKQYVGLLVPFFAIAGYRTARFVRSGEVRLYGCIPLAKRTIWGCSLLASLMWGAVMLIVYTAAYIVLWTLIIGGTVRFDIVPPSHYLHFLSLAKAAVSGIAAYGVINLCASLTGGFFKTLLLPLLTVLCLQICGELIGDVGAGAFGPAALLFPFGGSAAALAELLFMLVFTAGSLTAAYFAFTRSRAETVGRFSGIKLAVFVASVCSLIVVCMLCDYFLVNYKCGIMELLPLTVLLPLAAGAVVFAAYMAVSCRSLKKGLKLIAFYPITAAVFVLVLLSARGLNSLDSAVKINSGTIDCVMLPEQVNMFFTGESYDALDFFGTDMLFAEYPAADAGSEKRYEFRDPEVLDAVCTAYAEGRLIPYTEDSDETYVFSAYDYYRFGRAVRLDVRLRDGRQFDMMLLTGDDRGGDIIVNTLLSDSGYIKERTDMSRFKSGHIASPMALDGLIGGESLADTLIGELSELTPEQRAEVFLVGGHSLPAMGTVLLASPMNRYMQYVALTELTPKSTELYMRLCYENARRRGHIDMLIEKLGSAYGICDTLMLTVERDGETSVLSSVFDSEDREVVDVYEEFETARRQKELLIDIIENAKAPNEAEHLLLLNDIFVIDDSDPEFYSYDFAWSSQAYSSRIYLGISTEQLERLKDAFTLTDPNSPY